MSRSRSEASPDAVNSSPVEGMLRPSDHADGSQDEVLSSSEPERDPASGIIQPPLGVVGWFRWAWRQLTSMRTALVLLLLLAIAAVPGSLVPQRGADPERRHPVLHRQSRARAGARQAEPVRRVFVAVVLGDLHPAVRVADRMRHPAHPAPLEGAARSAAAHTCAPRAAGRAPRLDRRAGCRRPRIERCRRGRLGRG